MESRKQTTRTPTQKRSRQRVETILNATMECIQEIGFAKLKMKDISSRAQVSPSSVYQYFPDKQAILAALTQQCSKEILEITAQENITISDERDVEKLLTTSINGYYSYLQAKPAVKFILSNLAIDPSLRNYDDEINNARANDLQEKLGGFLGENNEDCESFCYWLQHSIHCSVCFALNRSEIDAVNTLDMARRSLLDCVKSIAAQ